MSDLELVSRTPLDGVALQNAQPQRPLTVIEHAMKSGATADQLERLLELQVRADNHQLELMREKRRMDDEDRKAAALLSFRRDFAAFTGENIVVPKSKFVDRGKAGSFWQAEWGAVKGMLSEALSKHGFGLRHNEVFGSKRWTTDGVESDVPWVYVTCHLEHREGHSERLDLEGPPGDLSANTPVQNMQATGSYLKRQSALAITGTATCGEDDENGMRRNGKPANNGAQHSVSDPDTLTEEELAAWRTAASSGRKAARKHWMALPADVRAMASESMKQAMWKIAEDADAARTVDIGATTTQATAAPATAAPAPGTDDPWLADLEAGERARV